MLFSKTGIGIEYVKTHVVKKELIVGQDKALSAIQIYASFLSYAI